MMETEFSEGVPVACDSVLVGALFNERTFDISLGKIPTDPIPL